MIIHVQGGPFDGEFNTESPGFDQSLGSAFRFFGGPDDIGSSFMIASEAAQEWMEGKGKTVKPTHAYNPGFKVNHKYTQINYQEIDGVEHITFVYAAPGGC